jgi:hypothetical protein
MSKQTPINAAPMMVKAMRYLLSSACLHWPPAHRISWSFCFCVAVKVVGNLTLYLTTKSPRWPGFFEMGIPRPGNLSSLPGCVGVDFPTEMFFPSMVVTVRLQPHNASLRSSSRV